MGNKCSGLFKIIKEGDDIAKFKKKYQMKKDLINDPQQYTYKNYNLLHYASKKRRIVMIYFLCENGFDIDRMMINGYTPLHCALENKEISAALVLIDIGANVNLVTPDNISTLMLASDVPSIECVKRILSNYDIQKINSMTILDGYTALCYAARSGDLEICSTLIESGCNISHITKEGKTVVDIAKEFQNNDVLFFFIEYSEENRIVPLLKFPPKGVPNDNQIDSIGNFTVHDSDISRTPRTPNVAVKSYSERYNRRTRGSCEVVIMDSRSSNFVIKSYSERYNCKTDEVGCKNDEVGCKTDEVGCKVLIVEPGISTREDLKDNVVL